MQTEQGQVLRSLHAVASFITNHAERLPDVSRSGARQRLIDTIDRLEDFVAGQSGGALSAMGLTRTQHRLRRALIRDHMAPIATIARLERASVPELTALRMPRGEPSVARLTAEAFGMAKAVEPYASVFIALGRPPHFVDALRKAATELNDAVSDRDTTRAKSVGATNGLDAELKTGRRLVHVLDSLIRSELQDDDVLLANWNIVKRVERRGGRRIAGQSNAVELPIRNPARLLPAPSVSPIMIAAERAPVTVTS